MVCFGSYGSWWQETEQNREQKLHINENRIGPEPEPNFRFGSRFKTGKWDMLTPKS